VKRRDFLKTTAVAGGVVALRPGAAAAERSRAAFPSTADAAQAAGPPDAPLFRDPIYDGSTDPTIVYNRDTNEWWMFYTARRANVETPGVAWVHGSDLGIATSTSGGRSWLYRGVAQGLDVEPGRNTFWAPEIVWHEGTYHMYVSYITGVPTAWVGDRHILHYTSSDLWHWRFRSVLELSSDRVIDAGIWPLPDGRTFRMWYKDEAAGSRIYAADSRDLRRWKVIGPAFASGGQEGPNVFHYASSYWMITAPNGGGGLLVYRSDDLEAWTPQPGRLLATPGQRPEDGTFGNHGFLLSQGERAYIAYFTQFGQRCRIQVAPLAVTNGQLTADRDAPFEMDWRPELAVSLRGGGLPT
jgi:hypothetical protein